MPLTKGQCIGGIRNVDDVRKRCRVDPEGCWRWRLSCTENGTPHASINGRCCSVRRWVLEQLGRLPGGRIFVVATCGNLDCVSPTCAEAKRGPGFMRFMRAQGRSQTPAHRLAIREASRASPLVSKLNAHKAVDIARRIRAGEDRGIVAAAFGISRAHANRVALGNHWAEFVRGLA